MSAIIQRRSIDSVYRDWLMAQVPVPVQSAAITAVTPANTAILEVSYVGRSNGAVQVFTADGSPFVATFKVQGSLLSPAGTANPTNGALVFNTVATDNDYTDIATISAPGITSLPANSVYARIRVICSSWGSGAPIVRLL